MAKKKVNKKKVNSDYATEQRLLKKNEHWPMKSVKKTPKVSKIETGLDAHDKLMNGFMDDHGVGPNSEASAKKVLDALNGTRLDSVMGLVYSKLSCPELDLEWTLNTFWANKVREALPELEKIYAKLVKEKYTEKNKFEFNDLDDHVWYIPNKESRVIVHTSQSLNFVYVWTNPEESKYYTTLHVRRFYDPLPEDEDEDEEFKKLAIEHGRLACLRQNERFDEFSDQVLKKPYFQRPLLNYFSRNGFKFDYTDDGDSRFRDGRDKGYVLSYAANTNRVESALSYHGLIKIAIDHCVGCISCALED